MKSVSANSTGSGDLSGRTSEVHPAYPSRPSLRYGLMGAAIGIGNRGVSALGVSVIGFVADAAARPLVSLLIGNRTADSRRIQVQGRSFEVPIVNYRMAPTAPLAVQLWWILLLAALYRLVRLGGLRNWIASRNTWIRTVRDADAVGDIRGGDSFSDIYGLGRFLMGSLPMLSVILIRGGADLLPQTYGPYKSRWARSAARFILRRSAHILSRDRESLGIIRGLIGECPRTRFCPDVAFALEAIVPKRLQIEPPLPPSRPRCLIGVNVNGLMFNGGYSRANMFGLKLEYRRFLERLVASFLRDPDSDVLLVPHTFAPAVRVESDPEACRIVMASVSPELALRVHLVTAEYDQNEIKGVIGLCDFFVGSRMHACIAALSQGIPAVGVAYSKKFAGVFDTVGAGEWVVDGRTMNNEEALAKTMELFARREEIRPELVRRVKEAQEQLRAVFAELLAPAKVEHHSRPTTA